MTGVHPREVQRGARQLLLSLPLFIFVFAFIPPYVRFLVTRALAPEVPGQVAARPAVFAVLIALVGVPLHVVAGCALVQIAGLMEWCQDRA